MGMNAPLPDSLVTALADRYRIERPLGRGGMATVYLAWDLRHDRPVALKILHPELAARTGAGRPVRPGARTAGRAARPRAATLRLLLRHRDVLLSLGRREAALERLERTLTERSHWMVLLRSDPRLDPLRSEPPFQRLLGQMKMPH
jgi:serine/threonine protein kinase